MESKGLNASAPTEEQFDTVVEQTPAVEITETPSAGDIQETEVPAEPQQPATEEATPQTEPAPEAEEEALETPAPETEAEEAAESTPAQAAAEPTAEEPSEPETAPAPEQEETEPAPAEPVDSTESEDPETETPANPYGDKSQQELIELLQEMIATRPVQNLRTDIEAIKIAFYKAGRTEIDKQREEYLLGGGDPEAFQPQPSPLDASFKELLLQYREKRDNYQQNIEKDKERAYQDKLQIIEELKELVKSNETVGNTFQMFRDLQQRWKDAGIVPQEKIKDLWDTYHHHVENFYNYIRINKELRDLDLKKNYEAKVALAEEAEALMLDPSATNAFHKLQKLHEQWREIGPVALEYKENLWNRFKAASTQINKRHQEYFEGIKEEQKQNLALKTQLCEKVEEIAGGVYTSHKEWNQASDQVIEIQKVWKTIGFAPKKENTKIYDRFRAGSDRFFEAKRNYYQHIKSEIEDNLQAKLDLCVQAEALKDSEEWKTTTDTLIALQKKWKEIGATSRKQSEQVWKRFRAACDHFFARKTQHFGDQDAQFSDNLTQKQALIEEMKQALAQSEKVSFEQIKAFQNRWSEIGFVPIKQKERIQSEYRTVTDQLFDLLRGGEQQRQMRNFKSRVVKMSETGARSKVRQERDRLYNKVRQLESDIQIWENNIGFFSKSKNADALVRDVHNKIAKAKEQIRQLIEKINVIDNPELAQAEEQPVVTETVERTVTETPAEAPGETLPEAEAEVPAEAETEPEEETNQPTTEEQ